MPRKKVTETKPVTPAKENKTHTVELSDLAVCLKHRTIVPRHGKATVTTEELEQLKAMGLV